MSSTVDRPVAPVTAGRTRAISRDRAIGAAITVLAALATTGLGQRIWPAPPGAAAPPASLLPFFIGLDVAGGVLFGLGICFLVFGYRAVARARQPVWLTYVTYVSISWLLLSWWPHGNLHRVAVAGDWSALLYIDYGFHLTLMAAGVIVAVFFIRALRRSEPAV